MSMPTASTGTKLIILLTLILLSQCSTQKHYKTLSFFFDGVPDPEAAEKKGAAGEKGVPGSGIAGKPKASKKTFAKIESRHPDYFKNICNNCHDRTSSTFLKTKKEDICFTCHDAAAFDGKYVHGPVAVKKCLTCHEPHESQYEKLLKEDRETICLKCHLLKHEPAPDGCNRGKSCTGCHDPHVSDNPFFVKSTETR